MMDTGIELAKRLLGNIEASQLLRRSIPYLDILKDLAEGGATFSTATLNTSSNFGSFDTHLKVLLTVLNAVDPVILNPVQSHPLPLAAIVDNLTANLQLLTEILQQASDDKRKFTAKTNLIINSLEQLNRASV